MKKNWTSYCTDQELEELLASLEDSDRYIIEGCKERLIKEIQVEVGKRKVKK